MCFYLKVKIVPESCIFSPWLGNYLMEETVPSCVIIEFFNDATWTMGLELLGQGKHSFWYCHGIYWQQKQYRKWNNMYINEFCTLNYSVHWSDFYTCTKILQTCSGVMACVNDSFRSDFLRIFCKHPSSKIPRKSPMRQWVGVNAVESCSFILLSSDLHFAFH